MAEVNSESVKAEAKARRARLAEIVLGRLCELAGEASLCWDRPPTGCFDSTAAKAAAEHAAAVVAELVAPEVERAEDQLAALEAAVKAACCAGCGEVLPSREAAFEHIRVCPEHPLGEALSNEHAKALEAEEALARFKDDTREVFERLCDLAEAHAGVDLTGLDPTEQRLSALIEGLVLRAAHVDAVWAAAVEPSPRVTGPDADGMLWIHGETHGVKGAVSVEADSIFGRAFLGYVKPPHPEAGL